MLDWISNGLTLLGIGQSAYEWVAGQATNRQLKKLNELYGDKLTKLEEGLYLLLEREVLINSHQRDITDAEAIRAATKPYLSAIGNGHNMVVSTPTDTPDKMQICFDGDLDEILEENSIRPLRGEGIPDSYYQHKKKAPITFTKYQQEFVGLIKTGFLKSYFGVDFKPYKGIHIVDSEEKTEGGLHVPKTPEVSKTSNYQIPFQNKSIIATESNLSGKTFKKKANVINRFEMNPMMKLLDWIVQAGHDSKRPVLVITFDWNSNYIWVSYCAGIAVNIFSAKTGKFLKHVKSGDNYYGTAFAYNCGSSMEDIIFGTYAGKIYHSNSYDGNVKLILSHRYNTDSVNVTKDGNTLVLLKHLKSIDNGIAITVFERSSSSYDFKESSIHIDKNLLNSYLSELKLFEDTQRRSSLIFVYDSYDGDLVLVDLKEKSVVNSTNLSLIRNISKHPNENLLVVLGHELILVSIPELKIDKSLKLPMTRSENIPPMAHSPCGRYLALSYAINGEVEIRDARTLETLYVLDAQEGIPQLDMSWDINGRYLACRYHSREQGTKPMLVIWDVTSQQQVFKTETHSPHKDAGKKGVAFRWAPDSTTLAFLVDSGKIRMQIFKLE